MAGATQPLHFSLAARHKSVEAFHAYQAAGWKITYDKPGHNETYNATFTFAKRR